MNPMLKSLCLMACLLVAAVVATPNHRASNDVNSNLKPTDWLSLTELENLPSLEEITWQKLESKSAEEGAELADKIYHISQVGHNIKPNYAPSPNEIQVVIPQKDGQKIQTPLSQFANTVKNQLPEFGREQLVMIIEGLPDSVESARKASQYLISAFQERFFGQAKRQQHLRRQLKQQQQQGQQQSRDYGSSSSEEETYERLNAAQLEKPTGDLVVVKLGEKFDTPKRVAMANLEMIGAEIARALVQLTNTVSVPEDMIHLIGQGMSAQIAGVTGREYTRLTGHKLRRITGLDPWAIFARNPNTLTGLARGDADFVDVIHTTAYGLGTPARLGDADFYPNGPSTTMPGADNALEASMRATRYFAESVRPSNERNFPAVAANSLEQYRTQNGSGRRVYMGIDANFDLRGDFILQVNSASPFGRSAPVQQQKNFHAQHVAWSQKASDYDY